MKKAHMIWKAKHQRRLTDEEVEYFLENHPRWDLLLEYAHYIRRGASKREAVDIIYERFSSDPPLMPGYPEYCLGNGEHEFECCCDECDYMGECFPEYMKPRIPADWDHYRYVPRKPPEES